MAILHIVNENSQVSGLSDQLQGLDTQLSGRTGQQPNLIALNPNAEAHRLIKEHGSVEAAIKHVEQQMEGLETWAPMWWFFIALLYALKKITDWIPKK